MQALHASIFTDELGDRITSPQYALLAVVAGEPGVEQRRAVSDSGLDRSTGTDVVARLVERGYLERRVHEDDRRRRRLWLSESGRALMDGLRLQAPRVGERLISALSPDERHQFIHLLQRILDGKRSSGG
ncbi:MarR family winged helix-turn-helix transcriptional regulator [Streptomyces blattellae]|uniref:MarR family winged helix-turn-helix transcriptional regulator n=1 Tax=Streptomyces blattellae TaxID=2569855 RepID=UPI0018ACF4BC|nr:MarR family winged helix-turn-helix transcriptional regulator [Streptomyces blattellae]